MTFPPTFDHATRGEYYRYLGQTYLLHLAAGIPNDKARAFAVADTQQKINGFESWQERNAAS
jgi:hypothetical protein